VPACWTADSGLAKTRQHWHAPVGDRRTKDRLSQGQRAYNRLQAGLRALVEQSIAHLANAWALRRWRGLLYRVRDVSAPPAHSSAWVAGCTGSPHDKRPSTIRTMQVYDSLRVGVVAQVLGRAARPPADSRSRSIATAFSIRRKRVSGFFALSMARTCSRLWL
jgi:hypothetical protein